LILFLGFLKDYVYSNCPQNTAYMDGKLGACSHKNDGTDILGTTVQIYVYSEVVLVRWTVGIFSAF